MFQRSFCCLLALRAILAVQSGGKFKHPSVGEVAVIGLPDPKWGEQVAAFLRPKPGQVIAKAVLIDYLRTQLAPNKTPRHWFVLDAFPMTGSGKIQKFKLRELWTQGDLVEL